jgi:hypothetical protein
MKRFIKIERENKTEQRSAGRQQNRSRKTNFINLFVRLIFLRTLVSHTSTRKANRTKKNSQKFTSVFIHEKECDSLVSRWMVTPVTVTRQFLPQPAWERCGAKIYTTPTGICCHLSANHFAKAGLILPADSFPHIFLAIPITKNT